MAKGKGAGLRMQKKNALGMGANQAPTMPSTPLGLKKGGKVKAKSKAKKKK